MEKPLKLDIDPGMGISLPHKIEARNIPRKKKKPRKTDFGAGAVYGKEDFDPDKIETFWFKKRKKRKTG